MNGQRPHAGQPHRPEQPRPEQPHPYQPHSYQAHSYQAHSYQAHSYPLHPYQADPYPGRPHHVGYQPPVGQQPPAGYQHHVGYQPHQHGDHQHLVGYQQQVGYRPHEGNRQHRGNDRRPAQPIPAAWPPAGGSRPVPAPDRKPRRGSVIVAAVIFGVLVVGSVFVLWGNGTVAAVAQNPLAAAGPRPGIAACFAPGKGFAPGKDGGRWSCMTGASTAPPGPGCTRLELGMANVTWSCAARPKNSVECVSDNQFCGQFTPGEPLPADVDSAGRSITHPGKLPFEGN